MTFVLIFPLGIFVKFPHTAAVKYDCYSTWDASDLLNLSFESKIEPGLLVQKVSMLATKVLPDIS